MASIATSSQYATWEYSYTTTDIGSAIRVNANIYFKQTGTWDTSESPGFCPCIIPNVPLSSAPNNVITDTTGNSMNSWIASNNGKGTVQRIADGDHGTGKFFETNLQLDLAKTATAHTVKLYIGGMVQSTYFWNNYFGETYVNISVPSAYTAPSGFSISANSSGSTSISVSASWTNGTNASTVTINNTNTISSSGGRTSFTGLTPNTNYGFSGRLSDSTTVLTSTASANTDLAAPTNWVSTNTTGNTIELEASSNNGSAIAFKYQYRILKSGVWTQWQDSGTFTGLSSNTNYSIEARCIYSDNTGGTSSLSGNVWTTPLLSGITLSRRAGYEHTTIDVSTGAAVATASDQYRYRLDSGSWSEWLTAKTTSYTNLAGNSTHTVYIEIRNTTSGLTSSGNTSITTWYDPVSSLVVNLTNKWFWYLEVNCSFSYQGGTANITRYEFDIGGQGYQNKGTTNLYSRGATSPTGNGKLDYNTEYICKVRITDNHGRTKEASATFKTLDERSLYINGELREVKVIKPDGTITYVTPNLLSVVASDGTVTNMNKIINNDNRDNFK